MIPRLVTTRSVIIALVLLTALAYLPALRGGFVSDDHGLIQQRQEILKSPGGLADMVRHDLWWQTSRTDFRTLYRPWVSATYWLEYQLGGEAPLVFHLSNLLVHVAASLLVFLLLKPLLGLGTAFLIAAVSAVTPVAMSSVGWISGRTDVWALLFLLLFLLTFRRARTDPGWSALLVANLCFFLALASKELAYLAPVLAWLLDRVVRDGERRKVASRPWWHYAMLAVPLGIYLVLRRGASGSALPSEVTATRILDLLPYFPEKVLRTAWHVLFPQHYSFFAEYRWSLPEQRGIGFVLGWMALLGIITLLIAGFRKRQLWAVGGIWFGLVLVPVYALGQSWAPMADFYAYAGIPGFWLFVIDGADQLLRRRQISSAHGAALARGAGTAVVALFAALTFIRLPILRSDHSLMSHMAAREPKSIKPMVKLAEIYLADQNEQQGLGWLTRAVQTDPVATEPRRLLASHYLESGRVQEAAPHVDALATLGARELASQAVIAHFYYKAGHCAEAVRTYDRAFTLGTAVPEIRYNYGLALLCAHSDAQAIQIFQELVRQQPNWPQAWHNLGIAYESLGRYGDAARAYREAVDQDATLAVSWESLVLVNLEQGRRAEAEQAAENFFKLNPAPERAERLRVRLATAP